jgi:hypothetical protein
MVPPRQRTVIIIILIGYRRFGDPVLVDDVSRIKTPASGPGDLCCIPGRNPALKFNLQRLHVRNMHRHSDSGQYSTKYT